MTYYQDLKNAKEYIKRADGYNGKIFIPNLQKYMNDGATLLELGMGPGTDVDLFSEFYHITGSDYSQAFLDIYKKKNPNAKLLLLDAITIKTIQKFDCIYSNKVLHLFSKNELIKSLKNQLKCLNQNGIILHTFWHGDGEMTHGGIKYMYYNEKSIIDLIPSQYEVLEIKKYDEMDKDDSFYVVLRKINEI